ncbi:MAG: hypothetical protein ACOCVA_04875 [Prolixibacteraceae bacterium]
MIRFVIPYSFDKRLFEAIDYEFGLTANPNHWICFCDGDTAFLRSDFGHQIKRYVEKYPDTGMFTSYASRCHYQAQVRKGTDMENDSILYHRQQAEKAFEELDGKVKEIDRRIAGHLMVIQKKTWLKIRKEVKKKTSGKKVLGVDTKISNAILTAGLKIRLMRGLYIFHYLRLAEGFDYKKHLE